MTRSRSAFILKPAPPQTKKAPALGAPGLVVFVGAGFVWRSNLSPDLRNRIWWAHQDSNLEQAGYEPAALTVELWARNKSTTFFLRGTPSTCGFETDDEACEAPWLRSGESVRA